MRWLCPWSWVVGVSCVVLVAGAAGCGGESSGSDGGSGVAVAGATGGLPQAGNAGPAVVVPTAGSAGAAPAAGEGGAAAPAGVAGQAGGAGEPSLDPGGAGQGAGGDGAPSLDPSTDPSTDPDPTTDPPAATSRPPCLQRGSQVVLLGDSYINWVSHTFPADLNREAGQTFRMYAVGGFSMGSGGIGFIPPELDQAVAEDPDITTIVMTGGGNDILVPDTLQFPRGGDCKMSLDAPTIPDCQKIVDKALEAADDMMTNGVAKLDNETTQVIYFFYPNVPDGTLVGGTHPNAILEYAAPLVKDFCDGAYDRSAGKVDCHFVDLRPVFEGHPDYFAPTDIHPNAMGSAAMAKAVWQTMTDNCIAQPESSGCCEP